MLQKKTTKNPIVGRKVKLLRDISNRAGQTIHKDELCEIQKKTNRGIWIKTEDGREITRLSEHDMTDEI